MSDAKRTCLTIRTKAGHDKNVNGRPIRLPNEILENIAFYLEPEDLVSLRLTCRKVNSALWYFFSKNYFTKRQFMVSKQSVDTLLDISHHAALCSKLRHLVLVPDVLSVYYPLDYRLSDLRPTPQRMLSLVGEPKTKEQLKALVGAYRSFHTLMGYHREAVLSTPSNEPEHCRFRYELAEAIRNLPQLETVDIRDFPANPHADSNRTKPLTSSGAKTLEKMTGERHVITTEPEFISHLFRMVMAACMDRPAHPDQQPIRHLDVHIRNRKSDFFPSTLGYPMSRPNECSFFMKSLRRLRLTITPRNSPGEKPCLAHFISLAPNLEWLRLNSQWRAGTDWGRSVFENTLNWIHHDQSQVDPQGIWFVDSEHNPTVHSPGNAVVLPKLERLELGWAVLEWRVLADALTRLRPTLKAVSFRHIVLIELKRDEPSTNPVPGAGDPADWVDPWSKLFESLRGSKVEEYRLSNLGAAGGGNHVKVRFAGHGWARRRESAGPLFKIYRDPARDVLIDQILGDMERMPTDGFWNGSSW
ncbi:hypothetical protein QBC47DRAFT_444060 [Echria macrotheca]|uniref:F-box domain-containing protein n=1 Tax=Echria macrotheca TaxID=438768 RepID=A0AAJ0BFX1_9PEZI|nr:hypothetical protein QBC47DRAFT_444060 [Echria macrotheca]